MTYTGPSPVETQNIPADRSEVKPFEDPNAFVFGWTEQAERWNGRLAMLGVTISVLTELVLGHSVLANWIS